MQKFIRVTGIFILSFFGAVFSSGANAGECDKVRSSYAHAACDNARTRSLQNELEIAYYELLASLSDGARTAVIADQREWRTFASLACTKNVKIQSSPYEEEQLYCVEALIWGRKNWLENSWTVDGVQTVPLGVYTSKVDEVNTSIPVTGKYIFSAVLMDGTDVVSIAFNAYAASGYADGLLIPETDLAPVDGEVDSELYVRVIEVTSKRISSIVSANIYYHGAAHGSQYLAYDHFLIEDNRALVAGDIFLGGDWQKALMEITSGAIEQDESLSGDVLDDISDALVMAVEVERWNFTLEGLEIQFQPYEIASFARGLPSVTIGWDKLAGILAPGALEIAVGN